MPPLLQRREAGPLKAALCAGLGWAPGTRGTIMLLSVWGKLWHPIAIICGRKYLMFLEEVGCGEGSERGKETGVTSRSHLSECRVGPMWATVLEPARLCVGASLAEKFEALPPLGP